MTDTELLEGLVPDDATNVHWEHDREGDELWFTRDGSAYYLIVEDLSDAERTRGRVVWIGDDSGLKDDCMTAEANGAPNPNLRGWVDRNTT